MSNIKQNGQDPNQQAADAFSERHGSKNLQTAAGELCERLSGSGRPTSATSADAPTAGKPPLRGRREDESFGSGKDRSLRDFTPKR